jgi:hypothetical protein
MSLLTKEQLKEILLIIEEEVNVDWPCSMLEMLHKWNEKQPPQTAREMYQRGYAAAERDLKLLVVVLKQQLAEKVAHIELEPQRQKDITAKQKIESFRSGYFRAILDLKPVNGADND